MKTALRWSGYVLFFLFATAVFVYLTFPTDRARRFAEIKLTEFTGASEVRIGDLSLSGLGGATLEDVTLEFAPLKIPTLVPGVDEVGPPRLMQIASLEVDASLFDLALGGDIDVSFEAEIQGGSLKKGRFTREQGGPNVLKIGALENVALGSEQLFQALVGKDILGLVSGSVDLTLPMTAGPSGKPTVDLDHATGQVELVIREAKLKGPMFDTPMGRMALGDADLGEIALSVFIDRASNLDTFKKLAKRAGGDSTIIHIASGSVDGEDLAIQVAKNSAITLVPGRPLKEAAVNIHLSVAIKDAFFDRSAPDPKDPKVMTQPNKNLRFVMQQPPIKPVLENGVFGIGITGVLGKPRVKVERSQVREGIAGRKPNLDRPEGEAGGGAAEAGEAEPEGEDGVGGPRAGGGRAFDRAAPMRDTKTRLMDRRVDPVNARPVAPTELPNGGLPPGAPPIHSLQPPPIPMEPDPVPAEPAGAPAEGEPLPGGEPDPNAGGGAHPEGGGEEAPPSE